MDKREKEFRVLLAKLRKLNPILREKYHISKLEVFGSYIHYEQGKTSDLDLLVTFSQEPSLFTFIEIENFLTDQLGIQVDLVMRNALKPAIGKRILQETLLV